MKLRKRGGQTLSTIEYIEKHLNGTNIGLKEEYKGLSIPIIHYCKNKGCNSEWLLKPLTIIDRIACNDDKMICCTECKIKSIRNRTHKICTVCKKNKPIEDFGIEKRALDGKQSHCRECGNTKTRKWKRDNKSLVKKQHKNYNNRRNELRRDRYKKDPDYRYRENISRSIKGWYVRKLNNSHTQIGCSKEFLRKHLETQFTEKMSHDNHGLVWSIDHIIPQQWCYDNMTQEEFELKCHHWTNLRPLLISDNSSKNDNLPEDFNFRYWVENEGWQCLYWAA